MYKLTSILESTSLKAHPVPQTDSCSPHLAPLWLQVLYITARKTQQEGENYCHNLLEREGRHGGGVLCMDTVLTYVTVLCLLNTSAFHVRAKRDHIVFELSSSIIF